MSKYKIVDSIEELKYLSKEEPLDCFIALNGGVKSSKRIEYTGSLFIVHNYIDDSHQELTEEGLYKDSLIGEAIEKHALFY